MKAVIDKLLKEHHVNATEGRRKILEIFLNSDQALVHNDIEKECAGLIDRVSVYRTLQGFLKKGLIHLVPTTDNTIKYAFTKEDLQHKQHQVNHVHFFCSNCNKTLCLNVTIPAIKLPKGFTEQFHELVITGKCSNCKY
jgi:Fur family ferric uptake transcriptional regulator